MVTWLGGLVVPALVIVGFVTATRRLDSFPRLRRASRPWCWRSRRSVQALIATEVVAIVAFTAWHVHRAPTFGQQFLTAVWAGGWTSFFLLPRAFRALRRWDRRHARLTA